jgi:hypothetical protein
VVELERQKVRVHLSGGLGNQLFQLAAILRHARGGEVILEYGLLPFRQAETGEPDICSFALPDRVKVERIGVDTVRSYARGWLNRALLSASASKPGNGSRFLRSTAGVTVLSWLLRRIAGNVAEVITASNSGYDQRIEEPPNCSQVIGYFQTYRYALEPGILNELKSLAPLVEGEWVRAMRTRAEGRRPMIIHLRLGDYRLENSFGIPGKDYYRRGFLALREKVPEAPIWLFSDEPDAIGDWMPSEILSEVCLIIVPPADVGSVEVLEVMRLGAAFVLGNSSFGYWAAFLSGCDHDLVTIPDPWFRSISDFSEFAPPGWVRLESACSENSNDVRR